MVTAWIQAVVLLAAAGPSSTSAPPLKYERADRPALRWGYNDLNKDGVPDTLVFTWNGKTAAFVSDRGKLPWPARDENRDWNAYFNRAFDVGREPPVTWNEMRSDWGGYTILVDRDGCGRFDSPSDWYYKALDLNGDGKPEAEYYHLYPGMTNLGTPYSNKLHVNLDGARDMSYLDFKNFRYPDEQRYLPGGKYIMHVQGSGFFLNCYRAQTQRSWENPIAWYDFNGDGFVDMVMRAADTYPLATGNPDYGPNVNMMKPGETYPLAEGYKGEIGEFQLAWELNSNTNLRRWHSLDMQLAFYNYAAGGLNYLNYADNIPQLAGLPAARFLSERMAATRLETVRRYLPYMDGYRIGMDFPGWKGVIFLFDEDDDDCRWEAMFGRYEKGWGGYADRIGDRMETDTDYGGKGKLYVAAFDGRIHPYHAEFAVWDVDYLGLYKGSLDRVNTAEGPEPPAGLRYPRVKYSDTDGNGFIDKIQYTTAEYGNEAATEKVERTVSLLAFADAEHPHPDLCDLVNPRVDAPLTGWNLSKWNGRPLTPQDFAHTPIKAGYDKMRDLYGTVCEDTWADATRLYQVAKRRGWNRSENLDRGIKTTYTKAELAQLKIYDVPKGYSRHLRAATRREKYYHGYWLREKVFADILAYSGLDRAVIQKYYYTGRIDELCRYLLRARPPQKGKSGRS